MSSIFKFSSVIRRSYTTLSQKILALSNDKFKIGNELIPNVLLGQPVRSPADIENLTKNSIDRIKYLYSKLSSNYNAEPTDPNEVAELFDELSNTICSVADWADCIATVHPNINYRNAAMASNSSLQNIVHQFNMDSSLYSILKACWKEINRYDVDGETIMVIRSLLEDFEYNGILLDSKLKTQFLRLQQQLDHISYNFTIGCIESGHLPFRNISPDASLTQWENLRQMLNCRFQLAQCLNHKNYAEWTISRSMAKSVSNVELFLEKTHQALTSQLKTYLQDSNHSLPVEIFTANTSIHEKYLSKEFYNFKIDFCCFIDFLCKFVKSMYNIRLIVESNRDIDVWDGCIIPIKVEKLNTIDGNYYTSGYIYLDLFHRKYKSDVSCHFTLFGRKIFRNKEEQLPRVFLSVPIFHPYPKNYANNNFEVNFDSVAEFMHEFGHSLHSVLYRGKYQHLSGTRCPTDISEIPSTLFESFLFDSKFLSSCQDKLDPHQVKLYCLQIKQKKLFNLLENSMTAVIDLQLNNIDQPYHNYDEVISNIRMVYDRFGDVFKFNHGEVYHQFFQHLSNYGAKYYSYLWAQACAGLIYNQNLRDNIFDLESHRKIVQFLLSQGAILNGEEIMANLVPTSSHSIAIDNLVSGLIL